MFTLAELTLMRQALDVITITGKDAQYVAQLQVKIEQQLTPPPPPEKTIKNKQYIFILNNVIGRKEVGIYTA